MEKFGFKPGTVIKIECFSGAKIVGDTMTVYPVGFKNFMSSKIFADFIHVKFHGQYFTAGNVLTGKYLGQSYKLIVTKILGCDGSTSCMKSEELDAHVAAENVCKQANDIHSVVADLSSLSLSDSQQEKSTCLLLASTPKPSSRNRCTSIEQSSDGGLFKQNLSLNLNDSFSTSNFSTPVKAQSTPSEMGSLFYTLENRTILDIATSLEEEERRGRGQPSNVHVSLDMIGGLDKELEAIMEVIRLPLEQPDLFQTHGKTLS
jgi:hypothetical protein